MGGAKLIKDYISLTQN